MQPHWPLTLYHDGDCPLCAREIAWLKRNADPARLQLTDIAALLGYSDQSALTRAYRRWTGRTPYQQRRD